jgi:Uma2 family endonuclease
MADTVRRRWTLAEFLAWENEQETRHEFVGGQIRAMVGASRGHNKIARNVLAHLYARLGNGKCQPYGSDMKIITPAGNVRYPDVMVDCGPEKSDDIAATAPTVVVEVLSKSTAFFDQTEKLADYQSIPSMQHVLHLVQERIAGELWTRDGDSWRRTPLAGADSEVELAAIGVAFTLAIAYDGVALDDAEANDP